MFHRLQGALCGALLLIPIHARAGEPVEMRTLFAGELARPAPPLALALRKQAEVEALARRVSLPAPVLEELRATDFTRGIVIAVTGDATVRVVSATFEPDARSLQVVATRSAPQGEVCAAHLVQLGGQRGLSHGVGRGGPADGPLGGSTDPWTGWTIDISLGERWEPRTITGTLHFEGEAVLRADGVEYRVALEPGLGDVLPPAERRWDPKQGIPIEVEGEVDHTVWMIRNVRRVAFPGTPYSAVRAVAQGEVTSGQEGQPAVLTLPDCSRLDLIGWRGEPAREMRCSGFLLQRSGGIDQWRFLVLEARPVERSAKPSHEKYLIIDGEVVLQREPSGRGPIDRPLGED